MQEQARQKMMMGVRRGLVEVARPPFKAGPELTVDPGVGLAEKSWPVEWSLPHEKVASALATLCRWAVAAAGAHASDEC